MTIMHDAAGQSESKISEQNGKDERAARQRRIDAIKRVAGMWADRKDIPADGLEYERELRSEWR